MGIVRFALRFPHTFYVLAALILFLGIAAIRSMPTDIFPEIRIPIPVSHRDRDVTGAIRQVVHGEDKIECRYLVIAEGHADNPRAARQS